jgi:hypothetical protein
MSGAADSMNAPEAPVRAVVYAAKSTEDNHGSIPTQFEDCGAMAEREGWMILDRFKDEGFSAYSRNRGPDLARARALAAENAPCVLVVQHSDRLARGAGDTPGAAEHLAEILFWARRHGVVLRSVQDDFAFTHPLLTFALGERNYEDSRRKSLAVKDGLKRRREKGMPVGAVPLGYRVEVTIVGEATVTRRVAEREGAALYAQIMQMAEAGSTPGEVARALNRQGLRTKRGGSFVARQVRRIIENDLYAGGKGYPRLIQPERHQRIVNGMTRLEPAAVQRRRGGRPPATDKYLLRGVGFCLRCGSPLYTRRQGGSRAYICKAVRQCEGTCDAVAIPAELAETQVLNHLNVFVGSVKDWIDGRLAEANSEQAQHEAAVVRAQQELANLDGQREKLYAEYVRLVNEGDRLARLSLEAVDQVDGLREHHGRALAEAEAVLGEWTGSRDVDAALDFYNQLADLVQGQLRNARGAEDLNRTLHGVLAGIWFGMEPKRERLLAEFELRNPSDVRLPDGSTPMFSTRPSLPPAKTPVIHPRSDLQTGTHTLV